MAIPMMNMIVLTAAPTDWSRRNLTIVLRILSCFLAFWGLGADSEVRAAFFSSRLRRPMVSVAVLRPVTFSSISFSFSWGVMLSA